MHKQAEALPLQVIKRDGRYVDFDPGRIESALRRCFQSIDQQPATPIDELVGRICTSLKHHASPSVEYIQDLVEKALMFADEHEAARHYILYRNERAAARQNRPIPDAVREAFDADRVYFPTPLQQFQFYDKYSRFDWNLGRRETWVETVDRTMSFLHELAGSAVSPDEYGILREAILNMHAMPSMRLLAMAGAPARRNNVAIYNCSYQPIDCLEAFTESLHISMAGCGVGFSVESKYVEKLPRIVRQRGLPPIQWVIDDSADGWVEALKVGLEAWFDGMDVDYDYSFIRPAGAILRTKGGRASGPEPLRNMLVGIRARILARQGSVLRPIDAHDIECMVGDAAVCGGMRRTAMISLFDRWDSEMRLAKSGDFELNHSYRWNANNSAVWEDLEFSQEEFSGWFLEMVKSRRGEPGIANRYGMRRSIPSRRMDAEFGMNPCVTRDTWVATSHGHVKVADLIGKQFTAMVDGAEYQSSEAGFWSTGVKPIFELRTKEGYRLKLTANHRVCRVIQTAKCQRFDWIEAGDLNPGDLIRLNNHRAVQLHSSPFREARGWLLGSLVGDGCFSVADGKSPIGVLRFWGSTAEEMVNGAHVLFHQAHIPHRADVKPVWNEANQFWQLSCMGLGALAIEHGILPEHKTITEAIEREDDEFCAAFLKGLFDADGSVQGSQKKGVSVRLAQSNLPLLYAAQRMLLRLGIVSTVYEERRPEGMRLLPDGKGGEARYFCQADHELVISRDNIRRYQEVIGFRDPQKTLSLEVVLSAYQREMNRERFVVEVKSLEPCGVEEVFDCTITAIHAFDANGLYVHNCGEIILRPNQFCNLSIAVARKDDNYHLLMNRVKAAAILGTIQSNATHFPGLRRIWRSNCEEERLLGVDITGQMDSTVAQDPRIQELLRHVAITTNQEFARRLGINASAAVTCGKPSGNSSQLLDCSSGLHARWADHYVRNVRVDGHSPIFRVLKDAGVPMDPENGQTRLNATTWVAHFPIKAPEGATTRKGRTAIEQCQYWLQVKTRFTEHNPSVTITYQPNEIIDLMKWVWEHRELIGGMSFLPADDAKYEQMPYEEIDAERYVELAAVFPQIDFSKVWRHEESDMTQAAQELACSSGSCEIDFVRKGRGKEA